MFKKVLVAVTAIVMLAVGVLADTATVNGITWYYTVSDGKARIGNTWDSAIPWTTTGAITIPSSLGGYPVTKIGCYAFYGCWNLTSVTIPNSVTSISADAFIDCSGSLFDTTTIPGVELVDGWVVGYMDECPSVLDLTGVRGIANSAFSGCDGLKSVTIPNSVTSIGNSAFSGCSGLTSVTIGNSVTSIGDFAFSGCGGLAQFIVSSNNPNYKSVNGLLLSKDGKTLLRGVNNSKVIIPNSVTSIGDNAFYGCSGLTSVTIPEGVTSIGDSAFSGCSGLTSVTIPNSVTNIGYEAFSGCSNSLFDTTTIPGVKLVDGWVVGYTDECPSVLVLTGVRGIGDYAFFGCDGLTSVTIPNSVTSIGDYAFYNCSGLTQFIVGSNNPNYKSVNGLLLSKDGKTLLCGVNNSKVIIPNSVTSIGKWAFYDCEGLTSVTIPNSVTSIGAGAFSGCSSLTSITIPNNVTSIGDSAFWNCSGLTSVLIGNSVTSIGDSAFWNCSGLTSITIPDSVTSIGEGAFYECSSLTSVVIPSKVDKLWTGTFWGCYKLREAIFLGNAPNIVWSSYSVAYSIFDSNILTIKVKKGTTGWNGDYTSTALPATWDNDYPIVYATESELNLTYKVAFNANGGSGSMAAQTIACNTWTKLRANAFKRTGYTFQGWAKSKTGGVAYKNAASVKNLASSGTVTLYAIWKPNTYKVAFNANGGKGKMSTSSMTYGKTAKLRANAFKRSGYVFIGWAKTKKGAVAYKNAASVKNLRSSGTITLYAVWAKKNYKVAFYANGGKGKMSAQTFTYGKAAKLKKNAFKRSGYTFIGWAKSASLAKKGTVSYKNTQAIKNLTTKGSTIKLYAVWAKTKYKVAFYANGGKGKMSAQTFTYGKAAKLKKNAFKRTGYAFKGWAKSSALAKKGTISYKNTQAIKNLVKNGKTVKLYAVWKRK